MVNGKFSWFGLSAFAMAFFAAAVFCGPVKGQDAPSVHVGGAEITGLPDDWTHHHVVFANPGTEQDAIQNGNHDRWQKIVNDPRYVIQQLKKELPVQGPAGVDAEYRRRWIREAKGWKKPDGAPEEKKVDWSMTSGGTGGLLPNHYPAKYGFLSAYFTASCSDFVVYPTGILGSSTQATVIAYNNIYKSPTCTGTVPGILLSIDTGGLADTSPSLSLDGTQVAYIQTTGSASLTGGVTNGSKNFTATAGLSASDVGSLITGTGIATGTTIATVTSATAGTLSANATATHGSETLTITGEAQLVLLKIGTGGGTAVDSPVAPAATTNANYRTCTGPCYTTFNLYTATAGTDVLDTNSAPFYVYADSTNGSPDFLYVGDDLGYVHKFTGVFAGTPAEVTTGWPAHASTETSPKLNSPVYDPSSGDIFVGDSGGYLHKFAVGTSPGTATASGQLEHGTTPMDSVLVDGTSGTSKIYQFVGYSGDGGDHYPSYINVFTATTLTAGSYGESVYFPNGTTGTRPASAATIQRAGTFDNTYFSGSGSTGNLYGCSDGVVYQIPVANIVSAGTGGTDSTVNIFSTPTSAAATCSPVTEFYNATAGKDWIFTSVSASGNATVSPSCTGACVYNYDVTTSTNTTGSPAYGLAAAGGTSGIVIDNDAAAASASEIYYTTVGSQTCGGNGTTGGGAGSCAVQATQANLQ